MVSFLIYLQGYVMTRDEILDFINTKIREEHGNRVGLRITDTLEDGTQVERDTLLVDSEVDSFGLTMLLLELDDKFTCFDNEWLHSVIVPELTIKYIVERAYNGINTEVL